MSILKVKSLFFYKNHEIKLKRFCINIELPVQTSGGNIQTEMITAHRKRLFPVFLTKITSTNQKRAK
jgi:hypothetical protein